MVVAPPPTMTAEEFFALHGSESNVELVRGQIVRYAPTGARRGLVCATAGAIVRDFVRAGKLGRVMGNDTYIRISPDSVRGADVCYISYDRLPQGSTPDCILEVPPDLVIEVRSPSDLWTDALGKMLDDICIGVPVVVILDPPTESASVYRPGTRQDIFEKDQTLSVPDALPGFSVPVARFFEE
jgi:Uma2 family endonuclease